MNGSDECPKRRYREIRNLWEVKNTLYYNKQAKRTTLEKLLEFVKTQVPDATMQFLESKIGILRNMYKKEHNHQEHQQRKFMYPGCGTSTNCVFWMTRLKPGNHFLPFPAAFPPPFPQPLQRLMRNNLGLPSWKKWMRPAGARYIILLHIYCPNINDVNYML
ncbi:hypothetical protein AB205_0087410 [Aquarana catesbeiana]|uniref:MADF domain-containing protein n=1 Tax=Aquarana catesbeiana TaxID=8400 RepID=A0A2G9RX49_AQUCT|nr:hypothetical protein AB205_0087410 [Aquarana catesbeiana]